MLILYQAIAYLTFLAFTNYPMNVLADMYGGAQKISTLYTIATIVCLIVVLILGKFVGKFKSVKKFSIIIGIIGLVLAVGVMAIPPAMQTLWLVVYFLETLFIVLWCTFSVGIIVGQWFPRRKGTAMGIATLAFPIGNFLVSIFVMNAFPENAPPAVATAFLPFLIVGVIGLLIGIFLIKDYPEMVGAYRDNDKTITPEVAKQMMEREIEAKKNSVWTIGRTLTSRGFWFLTIPMGFLLMCSVGMMTQTQAIIGTFVELNFQTTMLLIAVLACVGSWILGILDTKFGTKKAIVISVIVMIIGGFLGSLYNPICLTIALACLAVFMGASSNFTVSGAAQYWRREDFPRAFSCVSPVASFLQAIGPMIVATLLFSRSGDPSTWLFPPGDYRPAFLFAGIAGVASLVLILIFKPAQIKLADDKFREKAGLALDDELVGRK